MRRRCPLHEYPEHSDRVEVCGPCADRCRDETLLADHRDMETRFVEAQGGVFWEGAYPFHAWHFGDADEFGQGVLVMEAEGDWGSHIVALNFDNDEPPRRMFSGSLPACIAVARALAPRFTSLIAGGPVE